MHLIKEISVNRYGNDKQLMPTFSPYEIYQYSDAMLKHLPEKLLNKIQKTLLFSNKLTVYNKTTIDRRTYNSTTSPDITDENLDDRITLFRDQINMNLFIGYRYNILSTSVKLNFL